MLTKTDATVLLLAATLIVVVGLRYTSPQLIDFPSFYYAAQSSTDGASPYSNLEATAGRYVHPFIYPPQSLLLFLPLTALSEESAGRAMNLASIVFSIATLLMLAPRAPISRAGRIAWVIAAATAIVSQAFRSNFYHGQVNLVVLGAMTAAFRAIQTGKPLQGGGALSVAALVKASPAIVLVALASQRRQSVVAGFAVVTAAISAVAIAIVPQAAWMDFLGVANSARSGNISGTLNPSVAPNLSLGRLPYYPIAALAVTGATLIITTIRPNLTTAITLTLPAMLLVSPLTWEHHLVYALPAFAASATCTQRVMTKLQAAGTSIAFMCCFAPTIPEFYFTMCVPTIGLILLWAINARRAILCDHIGP
jgi:alpha-1,2-mannosyltransferase